MCLRRGKKEIDLGGLGLEPGYCDTTMTFSFVICAAIQDVQGTITQEAGKKEISLCFLLLLWKVPILFSIPPSLMVKLMMS